MITTTPSTAFQAESYDYPTGLTGTLGIRIRTLAEVDVVARTTTGIAEGTDPGIPTDIIYRATITAPATLGTYEILWDDASGRTAREDLVVTYTPATASGNLYVSRAAMKATLTLTNETYADADIDTALAAASRGVDGLCHRRFYLDANASQVRYYSPFSTDILAIDDLAVLTTLQTDPGGDGVYENTWTLNTDFVLEPENATADGLPWEMIRVHPLGSYWFTPKYPRTVKVTGQYGWASVPSEVYDATMIIASKLLRRKRDMPYPVITAGGIDASAVVRVGRNDPDLAFLLNSRLVRTFGPTRRSFG